MRAKLAAKENKAYTFLTPLIKNSVLEQIINNDKEAITLRLEFNSGVFGLTIFVGNNVFVSAYPLKKGSQTLNQKYLLDYYESNIYIKGALNSGVQTDIITWLFSTPPLITNLGLQEDLHLKKSSPQEVYDALSGIIGEWKGFIKQDDNFPLDYVHTGHLEIYFDKFFSLLILEKN